MCDDYSNDTIIIVLSFKSADPPDLIQGISNVTKNESDVVTFTCIFIGIPIPTVEWIRLTAGREVPIPLSQSLMVSSSQNRSTGLYIVHSTLLIPNTDGGLKKTDGGKYSCIGINAAANLIGAVNESSAFLTVQGEKLN